MSAERLELLGRMDAGELVAGDVLLSHCFDPAGHDCEGWHERFVLSVDHDDLVVAAATIDEWGRARDERIQRGSVRVLQPRVRKSCKPGGAAAQ